MGGFLPGAFCFLAWGTTAFAYINYAPNENVIEEARDQSFRILPRSDRYGLAVDADFFKPVIFQDPNNLYYKYDNYHGNGYWMTLRGEAKPVQDLTLNLKLILTHGTSSNGPTYLADIVPFAGVTIEHQFGDFKIKGRLSDAGRQTLGTGLFIEQKQTDGGYVTIARDEATLKVLVDGTGSYRLDGGFVAFDLSFWKQFLGGTFFFQENDPTFNPPSLVGTLYSKKDWDNGLGYGVEFGQDKENWATLAYVQYKTSFERFNLWVKPQFRHYGLGILGYLPGRVEHNYISYEENDKPYTNIMDIFAVGDGVNAYSTQFNVEYVANTFYRIFAETEGVLFVYKYANLTRNLFFRTGFKFFPFRGREDSIGLLVGNKYLVASTTDPQTGRTYTAPSTADLENKTLFMNRMFVMVNLAVKF